jgi:hypothetical protein
MDVIDAQALAQELAGLCLLAFLALFVNELAVDLDVVVGGLLGADRHAKFRVVADPDLTAANREVVVARPAG